MARTRKMEPQRHGPHTDPGGRGSGGGVGWGGLLVLAFGFAFVCYVWDVGGMKVALDGLAGGWDHAAHTHDGDVQRIYMAALPWLAGLVALAFLAIMFRASGVGGGRKRKARRKRKSVAAPASLVAKLIVAEAHGSTGPAFVRPVRLSGFAEDGVLRGTKPQG